MSPAAPFPPYSTNSGQRIKGYTQSLVPHQSTALSSHLLQPKKGWDGHPDTNNPSSQDHHQCMLGVEADAAEGFTDDNVAFKSQESQ